MPEEKANIQNYLKALNKVPGRRQRLGWLGPRIGMLLIVSFVFILIPLYLFLYLFNKVYFWIRNQKSIDPKPFFNFDRHKIAHLNWEDRIWCEYCEWANGTAQWLLAITNEIERRYCPIKNSCDPHCAKAKGWREEFLSYNHSVKDLENYYQTKYFKDDKSAPTEGPAKST